MKPHVLHIAFMLLLTGILPAIAQVTTAKLADFPTLSPTQRMEVFFPGEKTPDVPYTKLLVFEGPRKDSYLEQLEAIRQAALDAGMDGIILQQPMTFAGDGFIYLTLVGIGFKYERSLTEPFLAESRFYLVDTATLEKVHIGNVRYRLDGAKPEVTVKDFKWEFPSIFSQEWLNVPKGKNETEKIKDGRVVQRNYMGRLGAGGPFCEYEYRSDGRIKAIRFKYLLQWSGQIDFIYNDNGQEIARRMTDSPYGPAIIKSSYHADGMLDKLSIFTLHGEQEKPLAEVEQVYLPLAQILGE